MKRLEVSEELYSNLVKINDYFNKKYPDHDFQSCSLSNQLSGVIYMLFYNYINTSPSGREILKDLNDV